MKSLILSFLLILGLATLNYGKPINDIYSIKDQVFTGETYLNSTSVNTQEIAFESVTDTNTVLPENKSYVNNIPDDTKAVASNSPLHMKMKTMEEDNISDLPLDAEKVFYTKLEARLTEQYQNETGTNDISETLENDFYCYQMRIPYRVSVLINATSKDQVK